VSDRLHYLEYPPVAWGNVWAVYSDGGCVKVNPSPHAGTWAVVYVDMTGREIGHAAGYLVPDEGTVENNLMETFAALVGLEVLPDGWAGTLYTDNLNALRRITTPRGTSFNGPAHELRERCCYVRDRMPDMTGQLLCGHPTRAELESGRGKRGYPVSVHNVRANALCDETAANFAREHEL
jgi:ribonuclease HI